MFLKLFWKFGLGCRSFRNSGDNNDDDDDDDDDDDEAQQLDNTEQEMMEERVRKSKNRNVREGELVSEHNLIRTCLFESDQGLTSVNTIGSKSLKTKSNEVVEKLSVDQCIANISDLETEIRKLKQECTTKCYQLKIPRSTYDDLEEVVQAFYESIDQPVLDRIKLVEDQWRTLDLWEVVLYVNPLPIIKFQQEILQRDKILLDRSMTFRRSIVCCCIFDDVMKNLGWRVEDSLDIENDVCHIVAKLVMQMTEPENSNLLDCMHISMMNIQAHVRERDGDKLRSRLMTKKKYNSLNLACIILEQMMIDNKDNNVSWMRIVCTEFIDLVCQLIIEPEYQENIRWNLNYLTKLESNWSVADIYNLVRNLVLTFQYRQENFNRYLIRIRNFALHPTLDASLKQVLESRDENEIISNCIDREKHKEKDKYLDQVFRELEHDEVGQEEKDSMKQIIKRAKMMIKSTTMSFELEKICKSEKKDGVELLSSCLAVTSMALNTCKELWPSNTQIVSYCLLVARKMENMGRLLEILTGEGKSCVIAMVAATYALLGRTVDIVTSSPLLSQRDADEWRTFYKTLGLDADCNVEDNSEEDNQCYKCPIVYGTVETFARDILKTEFFLQSVRKGRIFDYVMVDEVDSMLIDQGVQCTYLSHDIGSFGMNHFEPILTLIWMNISMFFPVRDEQQDVIYYVTEPEVFFVTLSYVCSGIDPLQIMRLAEDSDIVMITKGFTDSYLRKDIRGQQEMLRTLEFSVLVTIFSFALDYLNLDINICVVTESERFVWHEKQTQISILVHANGLSSVVLPIEVVKERLTKMVSDVVSGETKTGINLPIHLRDYCHSRMRYWIDNAFLAQNMRQDREYVVRDNAVYPVDFKSTGVIETKKKWGDGLQQFLEMKHGLPLSPLSLITNFLSNVAFFNRYRNKNVDVCNILGVSGTLGTDAERRFMRDTFSVEFRYDSNLQTMETI